MNENIEYIKEELTAQEKFLESVIKIETFAKKYKKILIGIAIVIVGAFVVITVADLIKEQNLEDSNKAYLTLLNNPNDKDAEATLKDKNPNLYNLYLFQKAIKDKDENSLKEISGKNIAIVSDLAKYNLASNAKDTTMLATYSASKNAILKDFALLQEAYLLLKDSKVDEAKLKLSMIGFDSPAKNIANFLEHYTIQK